MIQKLRADMHTHSQSSHDSTCPIIDMASTAADKGIGIIAVTDHIDIQYWDTVDNDAVATGSHREAEEAERELGGRIRILMGLEMGEAFWFPDKAREFLERHESDAVIGSVHAVKYIRQTEPFSRVNFSSFSEEELDGYIKSYFFDYERTVSECDMDIAAHLTCPLYYINKKHSRGVDIHRYDSEMERILRAIIDRGLALEVNSHCIDNLGVFMPDERVLRMYKAMGGELITTGSDAHHAEDAGSGFDILYPMLASIGFENVYYYEKRKAVKCSLKGETK